MHVKHMLAEHMQTKNMLKETRMLYYALKPISDQI